MKNNYGKATKLNQNNADCFIRIPKSSVIPSSIVAVPNIGRNVYLLAMPRYSYFRLKDAKAEISCPKCKNIPSKRSFKVDCDSCFGDGCLEEDCDKCNGTGHGEEIWNNCQECNGRGIQEIDDSWFCDYCLEGKKPKQCDQCVGKGFNGFGRNKLRCIKCNGHGNCIATCTECYGYYFRRNMKEEVCNGCNGKGGYYYGYKDCPGCSGGGTCLVFCVRCDGTGNLPRNCDKCDGNGVIKFT